ncbi:hypothetical protein SAMN05192555_104261 [Franzmannia pantelleriensis]|uniref:Uncharacterized protein n=1 Tax=Franzmannia pantelleriensis TaxID=48727 RepID=A0A1G9K706_9GAMM|nr:hypothetical protein [Halomonas pantelleriensis]SDL45459.1 hypothetical protein SAMN05192555_104261 [Halomonas pantelleriensis]
MRLKPWIPAAMALTLSLGLTACGNGDEDPVVEDEPVEETTDAAPAGDDDVAMPDTQDDDVAMPDTQDDDVLSEPDAAAPDDPAAGADEDPLAADEDPFEAEPADELDAGETLGEGPDTLDEGAALPGETSDSDIDAFMEETERRFEEAQRQIEEQFEEVESQQPGMEGDDFEFDDEISEPDTQN